MKAPPPIPLDIGLTTPTHKVVATAASTACPPCLSIDTPISEHLPSSAATTPCSDSTTSALLTSSPTLSTFPPLSTQQIKLPLHMRPAIGKVMKTRKRKKWAMIFQFFFSFFFLLLLLQQSETLGLPRSGASVLCCPMIDPLLKPSTADTEKERERERRTDRQTWRDVR
uniref:Uncharacterized protein MANES_03G029500 n=1 Tax=Rhizophora mucronata TaxID=61149 RepID=A0A2P2JYN6_RHIMU